MFILLLVITKLGDISYEFDLNIEMAQAVEILLYARQGPSYLTIYAVTDDDLATQEVTSS